MTNPDVLREELNDLAGVLTGYEGADLDEWSPEWMSRQSLLARQTELLSELEIAEGEYEVEVVLTGGAVAGSTVGARFFGVFLERFQGTLAAATQTLMHGERARGRLAEDVLLSSQMRLVATAPGSFRVGLAGPERSRQTALDIEDAEEELPPFDDAVDRLLDVLVAAELDVTGDALTAAIGELGGRRALNHLVAMVREMAQTGTSATLVRRFPNQDPVRSARMTSAAAARLQQALSRTEQSVDYLRLAGRLTGVRWRTGLFDLEVPGEGTEGPHTYSGRVISDLRESIRHTFDQPVEVLLEETRTRGAVEGQESVTYRLVGIENALPSDSSDQV